MSLRDELGPRLTTIQELTENRYREFLVHNPEISDQNFRITLDDNGAVVALPGAASDMTLVEQYRKHYESDWRRVSTAVSDLMTSFRSFHVLDVGRNDLHSSWDAIMGSRTGPNLLADLINPFSEREDVLAPPEGGAASASVYNYLAYGRGIVSKKVYNGLLDAHDEDGMLTGGRGAASTFWDGRSADLFYRNLVVPFDIAAGRQLVYAQVLAGYLHGFRLIHGSIAAGVKRVADNCIVGLKGEVAEEPPTPLHLEVSAEDFLNGLSIAASIVGLFVPGGNAVSITLGVIGLGASVAAMEHPEALLGIGVEAKNEDRKPLDLRVDRMPPFSHANPMFVIESCQDAIVRIQNWIAGKDETIGRALQQDMSHHNSFNSQQLWLREPGGFSEHSFGLLDTSKEFVQAPIAQLRFAGKHTLPEVAKYYDEAMQLAESLDLPGWVSHYLPRSHAGFVPAQGGLVHLLKTTRNNLGQWGEELLEVANGLDDTEEYNAGNLRNLTL
jgi:hypothetical protein